MRSERGRLWQAARERTPLNLGDYYRTRQRGTALMHFNNGTRLFLKSGTQVEINDPPSSSQPMLVSVFGALSTVLVQADGPTKVHTAAGIAAVRGTEFLVSLTDENTTVITVLEGAVDFSNPQGEVLIHSNQQSTAHVGEAPSPPRAVDATGLVQWTANISGLPVEFETPQSGTNAAALPALLTQRAAQAQANPNSADAHRQLGDVYYDAGQYAAATAEFQRALDITPDSATYVRLGHALREQGNVPDAIAAFQSAQQLAPNDAAPRIGLALAHLAADSPVETPAAQGAQEAGDIAAARTALADLPNDATAQAVLGLIELRTGHNALATQHLQAAVAQDPQLYQAHALLGLAYLTQNQLLPALQSAQRAAQLQPTSAQAQGTLSMVLFFTGKSHEALQAANRAIELNPFSPFAYLTQGRIYLSQLQTDEARSAFQHAQTLAPNLPIFNTELGAVYLRLDMPQRAIDAYQRALSLDPNSAEAHANLGLAYQLVGREREAVAEYRAAFALDPKNTTAHFNYGTLLIFQGKLDAARKELEQGVSEQPDRGLLYARLAEISLYQQKLFAAQEFARRAVKLLPASAIAHYELGRVYQEQGRIIQAEQEFRQATTLDPQSARARFALGTTQEITESGLDPSSPLGAIQAANSSGAAQALDIQNIQTPGAENRIQAALQDPTVEREATRSIGDTQFDAEAGSERTRNYDLSYLHDSDDRRGEMGLVAQQDHTDGVRANADLTDERLGLTLGQKAQDNPSGIFVLAQDESVKSGGDTGETSNRFSATHRAVLNKPLGIIGFNYQLNARQRTRALVEFLQWNEKS